MLLLAMAGLLGGAVGYIIGGLVEERMWRQLCFDLIDQAGRERTPAPKQPAEQPAEQPADWPALMPAEAAEFGLREPEDKKEQRKRERQERTFWS